MSDFGRVPEGKGYGIVPKFALRLPDVKPGPKALYASFCTNASPDGTFWRSLTKVAEEFSFSKRQVQRWVNDLESAGLLVRMGWKGKVNHFMVIRNEEGIAWAKRKAVENISARKVRKAMQTASAPSKTTTPVTLKNASHDAPTATPVSHKHNLTNQTNLTNQSARQEKPNSSTGTQNGQKWGLRSLDEGRRDEDVQNALNALGNRMSWETLADLTPEQIAENLYELHGLRLTAAEIQSYLTSGTTASYE